MADQQQQTAVVTGASSGIGFEPARCFAEDGHAVVMVSHNPEKLDAAAERLAGGDAGRRIETVVADLATSEGSRPLYDEVTRIARAD